MGRKPADDESVPVDWNEPGLQRRRDLVQEPGSGVPGDSLSDPRRKGKGGIEEEETEPSWHFPALGATMRLGTGRQSRKG